LAWAGLSSLSLAACGGGGGDGGAGDGPACVGAKCDDLEEYTSTGSDDGSTTGEPEPETVEEICADRRADAFTEGRDAMQQDFLRWSCADVPGTAADERGQEYCEYFALVQLPGEGSPSVYGKTLGTSFEHGHTDYGVTLTTADIAALEDAPEAVVGQCVFTAWNSDMPTDCGGDCSVVPEIMGVPANDAATFQMTLDFNSREAAVALVEDCMDFIAPEGDPSDPDDPRHDPFLRACELNAEINETVYRKSDNIACAAAARLAECGCGVGFAAPDLPTALAPPYRLGFPLGGWGSRDKLPPGCQFADLEPTSNTLVTCDLTALEVLDHSDELKAYCQQAYADDIVVYVPIPWAFVSCDPPADEAYASTCTDYPWVIDP
jgi:hypothetical protein